MSAATTLPIDLKHIPGKLLHESPVHRRKAWGDLEELAGTIRQHGILEPMLVRPAKDGFELVFGHRRFRSGKLAKLEVYPCMVRELTDEQAVELMAVENLARKDLHPLEEAEGYEEAAAFYKVDVARVKSKAVEDAKEKKIAKKARKAAKP